MPLIVGATAIRDFVADFLAECCVVRPGTYAEKGEFYKAYRHWALENGDEPLTKRKLSERMQDRFTSGRTGKKGHTWQGVGLLVKAPGDVE